MGRTLYCARCMNSFPLDEARCPNLVCGVARPELGWGELLDDGDLLDRHYRVERRLAVGGAGITYLARETNLRGEPYGPDLAIKVLYQKHDGTFLSRLANEARVLQDLDHPHIVKSRGFVHRTGQPAYLVTLYASGGNLYDHVRHAGALPVPIACAVAEQILDALTMAHRRGVIHRDLKPQNVFLREVVGREDLPHALVADFGIAKLAGFMGDGLTTAGTFLGTPEFAAPEQFKGLAPQPAADIYAAMCVLWFCLTGAPPVRFADRTDLVGCLRTLRESLPPKLPADAVPERHRAALDGLFARTLISDPVARWSISAVLEALAELEAGDSLTLTPMVAVELGTLSPDPTEESPLPVPVPVPVPTAAPAAPTPEPAPRPRLRLRDPAPQAVPEPVRRAPSGLDALFESASGGELLLDLPEPEPDLSLDALLAPAPTPAAAPAPAADPAPRPADPPAPAASSAPSPARGPVLDASWETVAAPGPLPAPAPPPAPPTPSAVAPPAPPAEDPPAPPWAPRAPVLPGETRSDAEVLTALGQAPLSHRAELLARLVDPASAVGSAASASDPVRLAGACVVVAERGIDAQNPWVRGLLTHADPDVRATSALAVAATGKFGQLGLLSRLLTDPDPRVRLAGVHAIKVLGARCGREQTVRDWLTPLASDTDPHVKRAARP